MKNYISRCYPKRTLARSRRDILNPLIKQPSSHKRINGLITRMMKLDRLCGQHATVELRRAVLIKHSSSVIFALSQSLSLFFSLLLSAQFSSKTVPSTRRKTVNRNGNFLAFLITAANRHHTVVLRCTREVHFLFHFIEWLSVYVFFYVT